MKKKKNIMKSKGWKKCGWKARTSYQDGEAHFRNTVMQRFVAIFAIDTEGKKQLDSSKCDMKWWILT